MSGNVVYSESDPQVIELGGGGWTDEIVVQLVAQVEHCERCGGLGLSRYKWVDGYTDPDSIAPEAVFPKRRSLADLPDRVRERYSKMLELQFEPDAFAVRAGRVLEATCADQGITSGDLIKRLDKLVHRADVPQPLVDQAQLVRKYRNIGGHDDDIEVEEEDVPLIRDFVEALLTFLYWGPAELARASAALEVRRAQIDAA